MFRELHFYNYIDWERKKSKLFDLHALTIKKVRMVPPAPPHNFATFFGKKCQMVARKSLSGEVAKCRSFQSKKHQAIKYFVK